MIIKSINAPSTRTQEDIMLKITDEAVRRISEMTHWIYFDPQPTVAEILIRYGDGEFCEQAFNLLMFTDELHRTVFPPASLWERSLREENGWYLIENWLAGRKKRCEMASGCRILYLILCPIEEVLKNRFLSLTAENLTRELNECRSKQRDEIKKELGSMFAKYNKNWQREINRILLWIEHESTLRAIYGITKTFLRSLPEPLETDPFYQLDVGKFIKEVMG
jgi:hypothetical protein